jgi:hypothetical protein
MGRAETERRWNHISFYGRGPRTRPEAGTDHGRRAVAHTPRKRRGRLMEGFRGVKCEKGRRRSSIVRRKAKGEFTRSSHWACWACGEAGGGNKVAALLSGRAVRCTMAIRNMSTVRITIGHHRRTTARSDWPLEMGWDGNACMLSSRNMHTNQARLAAPFMYDGRTRRAGGSSQALVVTNRGPDLHLRWTLRRR